MRLKKFEGLETEWEGLWYSSITRSFVSKAINLEQLRGFKGNVQIIIRKNRYYKKGSDRPNYCFTIRDIKVQRDIECALIKLKKQPYYDYATESYYTEEDERLYTESEVLDKLNDLRSDLLYGCSEDDCIPSFYL